MEELLSSMERYQGASTGLIVGILIALLIIFEGLSSIFQKRK